MSQGEVSGSMEAGEDDELIAVWPWVDPEQRESGGMGRGRGRVLVSASQISWVEINGRLMELYAVSGAKYVLPGTLKSLEQRWAKCGFVRIHNSYLVSLTHVRRLCPTSEGGREVYLRFGAGGRYRPVSRRRCPDFKQMWISHLATQYEKSFR